MSFVRLQSGFKIAFAMLDQDGNGTIDKKEFKVLETVFSSAAKERKEQQVEQKGSATAMSKADQEDSPQVKSAADALKQEAMKQVEPLL